MAEKKKRRDWTKVDVEDIKKNLPKIFLFSLIILPLIFIGYLATDANSGVTIDTKTYGVHIENKTSEVNKTGIVLDIDFNNITDLVKLMFNWFPIILGLYLLIKVCGFFSRDRTE